ncbi:hypothetical protein Tco_0045258 [Tanacetum coccineum]
MVWLARGGGGGDDVDEGSSGGVGDEVTVAARWWRLAGVWPESGEGRRKPKWGGREYMWVYARVMKMKGNPNGLVSGKTKKLSGMSFYIKLL